MKTDNEIKATSAAKEADLRLQLQHAERLATVGQLAAGIAHELNGPLGNILGYAQLASKQPDLPEQVYSDLDHIVRSALHAREIVRKVMLFSRQVSPLQETVDLNQSVRDGLYLVEPLLSKSHIDVVTRLNEALPPINGDAAQMRQVVVNLMVNAVQAMPGGGRIEITTDMDAAGRVLSIADTGEGMDAETIKKCFLPFFTTKQVDQGTGLGLSVVHGIVEAHGGRIHVESRPGAGACFTLHFAIRAARRPKKRKSRSRSITE